MLRNPRPIWWIALAGLCLTAIPSADAEVIRFRNGVVLHGEVIESEQQWFKFRRYDTGGVVTLAWDQILEKDRTKLRSDLRLDIDESAEGPTIGGIRLYLKSGEAVEGLLDAKTTEREYWIKTTAGSFPYDKESVDRDEKVQLDILSVLSPDEAYEHEKQRRTDAGQSNESANGHFEVAEYCMDIAHYTKAKEHFLACQTVDTTYEAQAVINSLARLEELIAQAEANQMFAAVKRLMANKKFADAKAKWQELLDEFPDSKAVEENEDTIEELIDAAEEKYLEAQVKPRFFSALRLEISKRARTKYDTVDGVKEKFTLKAAKSWCRKTASKAAADLVATQLQITAEQVKDVFSRRKSYDFRRGTYGDGTFIVEKSTLKMPSSRNNASQLQRLLRGRGSRGGQQPQQQKKQELQTPDDWWKKASATKRQQWMTAYFAEYSGDMEIVRVDSRPCVTCGGKGYLTYLAPGSGSGGTQYKICHRCHGVAHDRTVVYR